jgi:hypothetical protein
MLQVVKSKTMVFSFLLALFGLIEQNTKLFIEIIGPDNFGLFTVGVSFIVAILRVATNEALSEK